MAGEASTDIRSAIKAIVEGESLDTAVAGAVMDAIMSGEVTPAQIGALVTALRMRGETVEEIAGFCRFLVSDDGAYLTGAVLPIDGGRTI